MKNLYPIKFLKCAKIVNRIKGVDSLPAVTFDISLETRELKEQNGNPWNRSLRFGTRCFPSGE